MKPVVLVLSLAAAPPSIAAAQNATAKPAPARVKHVAIEGEQLRGELPAPQGEAVVGRGALQPGSLIVVRADFVREIVRSVDEL